MTLSEAQTAYNIRNQKTIREWLQKHKSEKIDLCTATPISMGKSKKTATNVSTEALQKALKEAELKLKALNTLIDVAEEQLKIDIRKKSGARRSSK
jgi:transposase